jgi:hypothetical protein
MWMRNPVPVNRESIHALQVKVLYEKMIFETLGKRRIFAVEDDTPTGKQNMEWFLRVYQRCKEVGTTPKEFLSVMFSLRWGGERAGRWSYPFLNYLASDAAFRVFGVRRQFVRDVFGKNAATRSYMESLSPINAEKKFYNCFYNGFPLLHRAVNEHGFVVVSKLGFLFQLFMAFDDVFSPEFIFTHSQYDKVEAGFLFDTDINEYFNSYMKEVRSKVNRNKNYYEALMKARVMVARRERKQCRRQYVGIAKWEGIWNLML